MKVTEAEKKVHAEVKFENRDLEVNLSVDVERGQQQKGGTRGSCPHLCNHRPVQHVLMGTIDWIRSQQQFKHINTWFHISRRMS